MIEKMLFRNSIKLILTIILSLAFFSAKAQEAKEIIDYSTNEEYKIAGINITGVKFLDPNALIGISGLRVGQMVDIPGEEITAAAKKLWSQGLFSDVRILYDKIEGDNVWLTIYLQERPRLSSINFIGIKNSESEDLLEKINIPVGSQVTSHVINSAKNILTEYYVEKGFLNTVVSINQKDDPDSPNNVVLNISIDKREKVKINEIVFVGAESFKKGRLLKALKETKQRDLNIFKASKYIEDNFEADKQLLVDFYNENGYRDFEILSDSVFAISEDRIGILINVSEGNQYYLRSVDWVGNSVYPKEFLTTVLSIPPGSIYNQTQLNKRLNDDEDAVSSVYLDKGYLFSRLDPIEARIDGDSIDLEVRVTEGDQAYLNNIFIVGNTRTNEHVVRRELTTLPGDLFSKSNIIRSARQIGVLGHFDPEKIVPQPLPDPDNGTVDILYNLEERANDQFEISGGWGAGMIVGTIGVRFTNFSMKKFFDLKEWKPYPSGDGQSLSLRMQTNGKLYQSYSVSFMEPWLGGVKPNSLSVSMYRSVMSDGKARTDPSRQSMITDGVSLGFGRRLKWPDDYFSLYNEVNYQRYHLSNYERIRFLYTNGVSNLLSFTTRVTRFSAGPNPIYPTEGSTFSFSLQLTPPYSLINPKFYTSVDAADKYKWIEFHKWTIKGDYFFKPGRVDSKSKFVINPKFAFSYIGYYNEDIGPSPFENFAMGGDGMTGYQYYGREIIPMRGYENESLTPRSPTGTPSGNLYAKATLELRYPITLNPQASIYGLVFVETGKAWYQLSEFNPFKMYRSAGLGLRANLPMFGLLGIDWAYGYDPVPGMPSANKGQVHFMIGQQF